MLNPFDMLRINSNCSVGYYKGLWFMECMVDGTKKPTISSDTTIIYSNIQYHNNGLVPHQVLDDLRYSNPSSEKVYKDFKEKYSI
jgi:hypothetical protein